MSHSLLRYAFNPIGLDYISLDQPKAHELTNHILHPSPEPSRRSPGAPGKRLLMLCWMVPVSPTGTTGTFPRKLSTRRRKELISCSQAWKGLGNWQSPASLKRINKYNTYNAYNAYKWYNNYHSQDSSMFPASIRVRIRRTWFQCQS